MTAAVTATTTTTTTTTTTGNKQNIKLNKNKDCSASADNHWILSTSTTFSNFNDTKTTFSVPLSNPVRTTEPPLVFENLQNIFGSEMDHYYSDLVLCHAYVLDITWIKFQYLAVSAIGWETVENAAPRSMIFWGFWWMCSYKMCIPTPASHWRDVTELTNTRKAEQQQQTCATFKLNIKFTKTWTLSNKNVNATVRKYSSRAFIWVVTPLGFVGQCRI